MVNWLDRPFERRILGFDFMPSLFSLLRRLTPNCADPSFASHPFSALNGAITGTLVSVPQTMAYGLLVGGVLGGAWAGIGVLAALYSAVLVGLTSAILGGSPVTVGGPRATTALVFAALVAQLGQNPALDGLPDPEAIAVALGCAAVMLSGLIQVALGGLRLGRLARYIPHPVIAGFLNGSALLVLASQVWVATGIPQAGAAPAILGHLDQLQPGTLLLTFATTAVILLTPKLTRRIPPPLVGLVLGTAAYHILAALDGGAALGGTLAPLPDHFALHLIVADAFGALAGPHGKGLVLQLLPAAVSIATLATLDALLSITATDALTLRRSDSDRELAAQGLGNFLAGAFGLLPSSGSLARTSAALRAGGTTALSPILVAVFTLTITLVLAPQIGLLPQAVMAGLLIAVGIDLFDAWTPRLLRRLFDGMKAARAVAGDLLAVAVVVTTSLMVNLAAAVGVGVVMSLLSFVMQMAHTPVRRSYRASALTARLQDDESRRRFMETHGHRIAVIEMEGALFFGSVVALENMVDTLIADGIHHIILDLKRVKDVDFTGATALLRLNAKLERHHGLLVVSYVERERRRKEDSAATDRRQSFAERRIWLKLELLGIVDSLGEERLAPDTDTAIRRCETHLSAMDGTTAAPAAAMGDAHILRGFDAAGRRRLLRYATRHDYAPGEHVFHQGDPPDSVYFIARGRVEVVIDLDKTERKLRVQSMSSGAVFGEMAMIAPAPRSANVVAVEPTCCYRLSTAAFDRLRAEQSPLAFALIANVAHIFANRLRTTNTLLAELEA